MSHPKTFHVNLYDRHKDVPLMAFPKWTTSQLWSKVPPKESISQSYLEIRTVDHFWAQWGLTGTHGSQFFARECYQRSKIEIFAGEVTFFFRGGGYLEHWLCTVHNERKVSKLDLCIFPESRCQKLSITQRLTIRFWASYTEMCLPLELPPGADLIHLRGDFSGSTGAFETGVQRLSKTLITNIIRTNGKLACICIDVGGCGFWTESDR